MQQATPGSDFAVEQAVNTVQAMRRIRARPPHESHSRSSPVGWPRWRQGGRTVGFRDGGSLRPSWCARYASEVCQRKQRTQSVSGR